MKDTAALIAVALISAASSVARACPDAEYDQHLKELRALTSAVSTAEPDQAALAAFFKALPPEFSCFDRIFGFGEGPAPLYSEPQLYPLFRRSQRLCQDPTTRGSSLGCRSTRDGKPIKPALCRMRLGPHSMPTRDSSSGSWANSAPSPNEVSGRFSLALRTRATNHCRQAFRARCARPAHEAATCQSRSTRAPVSEEHNP